MTRVLITTLVCLGILTHAYGDTDNTLKTLPLTWRTDYQAINMPQGQNNLGMVGIHALYNINSWLYSGVGLYSAVNGGQGGFYALGVDAGVTHPIYQNIWGDAGIFAGSGGGHNLALGNGQFWEPHIGLEYQWPWVRTGISFSHIRFIQGHISSNQVMFIIDVPFGLTLSEEPARQYLSTLIAPDQMPSLLFDRNYLSMVGGILKPAKNSVDANGNPDTSTLGMMGVEAGHYFNASDFGYLNFQGAAYGHQDGFAIFTGGYGHRFNAFYSPNLFLVGRLGAGSAGGGNINTGGGFVLEPQLGLQYLPWPKLGLEWDGGYLWAPSSHYHSLTTQLQIQYYFDTARIDPNGDIGQPLSSLAYLQGWRIRLGDQFYFEPQRDNGNRNNIHLFSIKADYFLTKQWYLSGQTAFAYTGNAGGYFSGLVGPGFESPALLTHWLHVYSELLVGAAGGAGLGLGDGAIVEPLVGLAFDLTPNFGLYTSVGQTIAPGHSLDTTTFDAGFSYRFSTVTH